jgi:hypothetical protein
MGQLPRLQDHYIHGASVLTMPTMQGRHPLLGALLLLLLLLLWLFQEHTGRHGPCHMVSATSKTGCIVGCNDQAPRNGWAGPGVTRSSPANAWFLLRTRQAQTLTCSSKMTYLYSTRCPAGSISCGRSTRRRQHSARGETSRGLSHPQACPWPLLTSQVHTSPWFQVIGTLAMLRKLQPKGICEPPTHSICLLCTL